MCFLTVQQCSALTIPRDQPNLQPIGRIFWTRKVGAASGRSAIGVSRKQALPSCPPTSPRDMAPTARQVSALPPPPIPRP